MPKLYEGYIKRLKHDLDRWGTWQPNMLLAVGNAGGFRGVVFHATRDLTTDYGIRVETQPDAWTPLFYLSDSASERHVKLSGEVKEPFTHLGELEAGIALHFSGRHTVFVLARQKREIRMSNVDHVCHEIRRLISEGKWDPRRCVVTDCTSAEDVNVCIAEGRDATVELKVGAGFDLAGGLPDDLADIAVHLEVAGSNDRFFHTHVPQFSTPMFGEPIRIARRLWGHFGGWYLVEPSGERQPVHFPAAMEPDEYVEWPGQIDQGAGISSQLEWLPSLTDDGTQLLAELPNDELFEAVGEENDDAEAAEATLASFLGRADWTDLTDQEEQDMFKVMAHRDDEHGLVDLGTANVHVELQSDHKDLHGCPLVYRGPLDAIDVKNRTVVMKQTIASLVERAQRKAR